MATPVSWRGMTLRVALGVVGSTVNVFAMVATVYGALAQSIRDQGNGPAHAGWFHLGYVGVNAIAMGLLLATLADDEAKVLPTMLLWAAVCGAASAWYWNWAL